ncbi:hypothetical protein V6O07_04170, partial [Arthrospira platensis SPKY2]
VVIAGRAGVPRTARAVVITLTAVDPAAAGYASVTPCTGSDRSAQASTSTLNYEMAQTTANTAVTLLDDDGSICMFSSAAADYLVDVVGWLAS